MGTLLLVYPPVAGEVVAVLGRGGPSLSTGRKAARLSEHPEHQAHLRSPRPCSSPTAVREQFW